MGSVGAHGWLWRELFALPSVPTTADLVELIRARVTHLFGGTDRAIHGPHWRDDQHLLSMTLQQSQQALDRCQFFTRNSPMDRIDRVEWPPEACLAGLLNASHDAHVLLPGSDNWHRLRALFRLLVPDDGGGLWAEVEGYVADYRAQDTAYRFAV